MTAPRPPKKIPVGRLTRIAKLAVLGTKTGASLVISKTGESAAESAAEVLGSLRGLAARVGQMASYVDGVVPDHHRAAYEAALSSLRAAAPTSSPEQIRIVVEDELGAPIDRLFAEWDHEPFASASIGQVHRARLDDGREVADGHVNFVDFGCVQPIEKNHQARARDAHRAAIAGDEASFERAVAGMLRTKPGSYETAAVAYTRKCFEPLFSSPYHVKRGYVASLVADVAEMKRHMLDRKSGFIQLPPGMVLLNRLQFGFYSVLARFDVRVDYRRVESEFLKAAGLLD